MNRQQYIKWVIEVSNQEYNGMITDLNKQIRKGDKK